MKYERSMKLVQTMLISGMQAIGARMNARLKVQMFILRNLGM